MRAMALGAFPDAVVLLHGQPGSARDWASVVHLLGVAAPATRVLALDRPGWGHSAAAPGGLYDNAAHVADALDTAGVGSAVVVGHSWGGGVALAFAASHPARVAGLVVAGSLNPTQEPGILDMVFGVALAGPVLARTFEAVLHRLPRWRRVRDVIRHVERRRWQHDPDERARRAFVRAYRSWLRPGIWRVLVVEEREYRREQQRLRADLGRIRAPALVVVGDRDEFESVDAARALADALRDGRLRVVENAGHTLPWSRPGVLVRAVADVATMRS